MKKRQPRKLTLQRETLHSLRREILEGVPGGGPISDTNSYWNSCQFSDTIPPSVCDSCLATVCN